MRSILSLLHKCKKAENPNISWSSFQQIIICHCSCARAWLCLRVYLTSVLSNLCFCEPDPNHEVPYKFELVSLDDNLSYIDVPEFALMTRL